MLQYYTSCLFSLQNANMLTHWGYCFVGRCKEHRRIEQVLTAVILHNFSVKTVNVLPKIAHLYTQIK